MFRERLAIDSSASLSIPLRLFCPNCMKATTILTLTAAAEAICIAILLLWQCNEEPQPPTEVVVVQRDTITIRDTVPIPVEIRPTKEIIEVKVPVHDTVMVNDTVVLSLDRYQSVYSDSIYEAYVSGYDARLDSIHLYLPTTTITKTVNIPPPRWSIGPSVGVGYGLTSNKVDAFIGISATYRLWP